MKLPLLTLTLFLSLLNLTAYGQGSRKPWPVQTKGQGGLREPQERATLPVPTSGFSKPSAKPAGPDTPVLAPRGAGEWALARGWRMVEAPKVSDEGEAVSRPGYSVEGWLKATVPGTVLTTLVDRGVYPDPDYGLNNLAIPETERGAARVEVELWNYNEYGVALAAQVVLRDAATGERVLPAYASDNYVSLVPGERRLINIEVPGATRGMNVELKGWNVRRALVPVVAR